MLLASMLNIFDGLFCVVLRCGCFVMLFSCIWRLVCLAFGGFDGLGLALGFVFDFGAIRCWVALCLFC